ncbi:MAG: hypothetical protein H0V87_12145 [Chloroflexi bacterium]|nr:hypothetical protein [Chloroflexota bacterium]
MKTRITTAAAVALLAMTLTVPVSASTTSSYQSVFVEPYGGPVQSPFDCPPGMSCGSGTISGLGHIASQSIVFGDCGFGCHLRTVIFADGSVLLIREVQPAPFRSPGAAGAHGYIGFGLPGNPQFADVTQTIVGGTGRFAGATGGGTARVKIAGGVAIIKGSGTITLD